MNHPTCKTCPYGVIIDDSDADSSMACHFDPPFFHDPSIDPPNFMHAEVEQDNWCSHHPDIPEWIVANHATQRVLAELHERLAETQEAVRRLEEVKAVSRETMDLEVTT